MSKLKSAEPVPRRRVSARWKQWADRRAGWQRKITYGPRLIDIPPQLRADVLPSQALREERINCVTHALGLALCLGGCVPLLSAAWAQGNGWMTLACAVYLATLVGVFAASTCSHFFLDLRLRHFFRRLDQGFIYLLIAGTMTPYGLAYFASDGWALMLVPIWAAALFGFCAKMFWGHRIETMSIATYFVLGWMPILGVQRIFTLVPTSGLVIICVGAASYTLGTLFLLNDRKCHWFHAMWHLLVIGGTACGYLGILLYAVPYAG